MTIEDTDWPNIMPPFEAAVESIDDARVKPTPKRERVTCEICGREYSKKHLYNHRRSIHNIYGGKSGRIRTKPYPPKKTMEVAPKPVKLPPLTAEQITTAAVEALWPKGIPHDKLLAVLRWNNQTHSFLTEVQQ